MDDTHILRMPYNEAVPKYLLFESVCYITNVHFKSIPYTIEGKMSCINQVGYKLFVCCY